MLGVSRGSTSRTSAASCGSPEAGTCRGSAGTARAVGAGHPDRLPDGDSARPAVDGGRDWRAAKITSRSRSAPPRQRAGNRATLQSAAHPAHIWRQRVHQVLPRRYGTHAAPLGPASGGASVGLSHDSHCRPAAVGLTGTVRWPPRPPPPGRSAGRKCPAPGTTCSRRSWAWRSAPATVLAAASRRPHRRETPWAR